MWPVGSHLRQRKQSARLSIGDEKTTGRVLFDEIFPKHYRLSECSAGFSLGLGLFGGHTPIMARSLIAVSEAPTRSALIRLPQPGHLSLLYLS